jgi:hypothetical protein
MDTPEREPEPLRDTTQDLGQIPEPPPEAGPIRSYGWEWGREEDRRPRLPWIGIFLVVYGALLLVDRAASQYLIPSNLLVLAAGLAFIILWLLRRGTFSLYAGAFLTASAIPGLVKSIYGASPDGLGTLSYGVALVIIAAVRMSRGGGIGWQALLGVTLVALGGSQLALPDYTQYLLPIALVVLGLVLLTRRRD